MILLNNIHLEYDDTLIENGEIYIHPGKLTLITGISGSGKTTLLYTIALLEDNKCDYYWDDIKIETKKQREAIRKHDISMVYQDNLLYEDFNVADNLHLHASLNQHQLSEKDMQDLLKKVSLDIPLDQKLSTLSGGERQRLAIACALAKKTKMLILDEPSSALDKENECLLLETLKKIAREEQIAIVIASHSLRTIEACDVIYRIDDKQLMASNQIEVEQEIGFNDRKDIHSFLANYITLYKKRFKRIDFTVMITSLVLMVLILLINTFAKNYLSKQIDYVNDISPNKIYLRNPDKTMNYDELFKHDTIVHPYYHGTGHIGYQQFSVIQYTNEDKMYLHDSRLLKESDQKIYISHSLSKYFDLETNNKISFMMKDEEVTLEVTDILYSGSNEVFDQGLYYILVPDSMIQQLPNVVHIGDMIYSKTFAEFLDHIDQVSTSNELERMGAYYYYQNTKHLTTLLDKANLSMFVLRYLLSFVFAIMIILLHFFDLRRIKSHITLMKTHGVEDKTILTMISDIRFKSVLMVGISILVLSAIYSLMMKEYEICLIMGLLSVILWLIDTSFAYLYIHSLKIVKEMRE